MGTWVCSGLFKGKWDNSNRNDVNDMMPIAYGQTKLENEKLKTANNSFVWH
jgi:hypothetical protein